MGGVLAAYGGGWRAALHAHVQRIAGRSTLARVAHHGPLRLQKALWPEGPDPVHLIVLHPPGGIAGGDSLSLRVDIDQDACALLTTPGAGRWYRADAPAFQATSLHVGPGACLEWLPQEVIVHDGVRAHGQFTVDVADGAVAMGCEVTVLGRRESGERVTHGEYLQRLTLRRGARLLFDERSRIDGSEAGGSAALGAHHVSGIIWAVSRAPMNETLAAQVEAAMDASGVALCGASCVDPFLLLARAVDSSTERARAAMTAAWTVIRPALTGREAIVPRIWST